MSRRIVALCLLGAGLVTGAAPAAAGETAAERRVLVFSIPGVTWTDVRDHEIPNLRAFLDESAVASLTLARTIPHDAGPADAYLTFGAGSRSIGRPNVDGDQVERDEVVAGGDVTELFTRRTGEAPDDPILSLGFATVVNENDDAPYDAVLGAVPDELREEGIRVGVVANADGVDGPGQSDRHRQAALALTSSDGGLQSGAVATDLLRPSATAPFGVELDPDRVIDEFQSMWRGDDSVVALVEASDLARVQRYGRYATAAQRSAMRADALRDADELFGRILEDVDPERDVVLVIAPTDRRRLTVAGLQGPGIDAGWLKSASTQRPGVVSTIDVGPTLLDQFGIDFTEDMEGRPFEVVADSASLASRTDHMIDDARGAARRSERLFPMTAMLVILLGIVVLATIVVVADPAGATPRRRHTVAALALFALAALPATLFVQLVPGHLGGLFQYTLLVAAIAAVLTAFVWFVRPRPYGPLVAMLSVMLAVILLDAMTGSHLQYNAVFGYSPTSNSRIYGISNYSFGQVVAASLLLATSILTFVRSKHAFACACALLGFVLIVEGMPAWGSDVGGILAGVPTFLLFVYLIRRGKIRARTIVVAGVITLAAIGLFAGIDLARPEDERAHLGRLVERVNDDGFGPLFAIVQRKFEASLRESTRSFWVVAIPIGVGLIAALQYAGDRPLRRLRRDIPTLSITLVTLYAGAVLGSALNDSGAIVGGLLFFTLANALAYLAVESGDVPLPDPVPEARVEEPV
jgi:hypothetical protein